MPFLSPPLTLELNYDQEAVSNLMSRFSQDYSQLAKERSSKEAYDHTWPLLLQARETVGAFASPWRYSNHQIQYHYTKDKSHLLEAIQEYQQTQVN